MFFIELEPVFNNEGLTKPLDFSLDMKNVEYNGGFPFKTPVCIKGEVKNSTGIVSVSAKAEFTLSLTCTNGDPGTFWSCASYGTNCPPPVPRCTGVCVASVSGST